MTQGYQSLSSFSPPGLCSMMLGTRQKQGFSCSNLGRQNSGIRLFQRITSAGSNVAESTAPGSRTSPLLPFCYSIGRPAIERSDMAALVQELTEGAPTGKPCQWCKPHI